MASLIAIIKGVVDSAGSVPTLWLVLGAFGAFVALVTAGAASLQHLRRVIRYRRVANELRRVHDAAYRERFGDSGRLA